MSDTTVTPSRIGRYEIAHELGRGAMGVVYLARDPRLDRQVALKTLQLQVAVEPSMLGMIRQRFLNEGRAVGKLRHPGVVGVHDADECPTTGLAYLAMEYVPGSDLRKLYDQGLPADRVVQVVREVAAALDHAHEREVIHRDVKPANVLVDEDGHARLTDFGIARLASSTVTQAGQFLGSPSYMSPEQVRGQQVTGASDVFALAIVAYEGLTRRRPFDGRDLVSTTHAIANEEPERPSAIVESITPAVDRVIAKGLAKKPEERHATATEFAEELAAAVDEPPAGAAAGRWKLAAMGGAVLAVLGAVALWAAIGGGGGDAAPPVKEEDTETATSADPPSTSEEEAPPPEVKPPVVEPPPSEKAQVEKPPAEKEPVQEDPPPPPQERPSDPSVETPPVVPTEEPPPAVRTEGTLQVDLYTFRGGRLVVRDGGTVLINRHVDDMEQERGSLMNPKRHFKLIVPVASGERSLSFEFVRKKGKRLRKRALPTIPAGGRVTAVVDIGTLGRDMDLNIK